VVTRLVFACLLMLAGYLQTSLAAESGDENFIVMASTTSTRDSGLLDYLLPAFTEKTGIAVRVIARGTGQALEMGRRGDADLLLVHDRASEEEFIAEGFGSLRRAVMHNDFVLVGPIDDPAGIAGMTDALAAMKQLADHCGHFISRADDSGTHKAETRLWRGAGVAIEKARPPCYIESGSGMGATLNMAAGMSGYTLSDRGTWLSFRNRSGMQILVEGDPPLFNPYSVMLVNPERHPHVRAAEAAALIDWMVSAEGQKLIGAFRVDGLPLFFPDAAPEAAPDAAIAK